MFFADQFNNSFRQKVVFKCIPVVKPIKNGKKWKKNTNKPASIERMSSPIPAKLPVEIKEISKYFKIINPLNDNKNDNKSYAQASNTDNNIREVLKIKKTFPNL